MECLSENTVIDLLDALVTPQRRAEIDAHVATCTSCRRLVSALLRRSTTTAAAPTAPRDHAPGTIVGRYTLGPTLGRGASGVVVKAHDAQLDRSVALKLLHPGAAQSERIQREARALAKLGHPNVVAVFDAGTADDELFVSMELVDGTDLRTWLKTPRAVADILRAFRQLADGLIAAHAVGIIHRDIKPENVLVGNDGRVRIGDFGLAGGADGALEFIGTPAYMAPEQFDAGLASEATDQFAFCISLYEALHGKRPFGINLAEDMVLPKPARSVPRHVRRALERGLAVDPARRFPSMKALNAALRPRYGVKLGIAAAIAGLAVGGIGFAMARVSDPPPPCAELVDDAVWTPSRALALQSALRSTNLAYADDAWRAAAIAFGKFDAEHAASRRASCEATRVSGVQSEHLMDLRAQCLDQAHAEVLATYDLLVAKPVAIANLGALPRIDMCANTTSLLAPVPPPSEAERAAAVAIGLDLARASALDDAGRWKDALAATTPLVARARALNHAPTRAHALFLLGQAQSGGGDAPSAEASLREAYTTAEVGRDDLLAARAAVELVWVVGQTESRYKDGNEWAFHATTLLARAGGDAELEARLASNQGNIAFSSSHFQEARDDYQRALTIRMRIDGPDSRAAAMALGNVARGEIGLGNNAAAEATSVKAIAALEKALGPHHPDLALALQGLGTVQNNRGDVAAALVSFDRALAIAEPALGHDHPSVGQILITRGYALTALGRQDEAIASHERAIAIFERPGGTRDHLEAALLGKGDAQLGKDDAVGALATYERAVAIAIELDPANDITANALESRGSAKLALHKPADALADYTRALAIREKVEGVDYFENATSHAGIGEALLALNRPAEAASAYRRALKLQLAYDGDPVTRANTRFFLAKALPRGSPEIATLLATATTELEAAGEPGAKLLAELRAWHR